MDLLKLPYKHSFSHEWKLKKSDLEKDLKIDSSGLLTSWYYASRIAEIRYCFEILHYGDNNDGSKRETWIYLNFLHEKNVKEIEAKYQILIESANFSKCFDHIYKEDKVNGKYLCKTDEFFDPSNNYFVGDEMVIKINGTLKFDRPLISKMVYPFFAEWSIRSDDLTGKTSFMDYLLSEPFYIPSNFGIKYGLRLMPNENDRGKVFIFLMIDFESNKKINAHFTIKINSETWSKTDIQMYENSQGHGFEICSTDDLFNVTKGYIINGEMVITVEGNLFVEKKDPEFTFYENRINKNTLAKTFLRKTDFKIVVNGNEINAYKDLLADISTVFAGMLQSGMKEAIEGKMEITDFPFKTVDAAIKLINGIFPTFILDDMLPLLVFSDKYDIQIIKDLIENHLISELAPSNVCQLIHFSTLFNARKLYGKSAEYFRQCSNDKTAVDDLDLIDRDMFCKIFFPLTTEFI